MLLPPPPTPPVPNKGLPAQLRHGCLLQVAWQRLAHVIDTVAETVAGLLLLPTLLLLLLPLLLVLLLLPPPPSLL